MVLSRRRHGSFLASSESKNGDDIRKNIYSNIYQDTSKVFRGFFDLMTIWKGSVLKLIWHDLFLFLFLYTLLSLIYRYVLFHHQKPRQFFELICVFAAQYRTMIPITFLTGFYVTQVVARYWEQYMSLPWPDMLALKLVSYIPGKDNFRRNLRRTVMRYVNLSMVLALRLVSQKVCKRFPSHDSLVEGKLMLPHEAARLQAIELETPHESTWAPLLWALKLIQRARSDGKITIEPPVYANLVSSFNFIEEANRTILKYGWVSFPLAYTQVATISVFSYFFASLFACQYLIPPDNIRDTETFPALNISYTSTPPFSHHSPDLYIPFFTILEFISYMGWIKVAENLLNPFGDDDEDFQTNYLIDRNVKVCYMIVDEAEMQIELAPDPFIEAGISVPSELLYKNDVSRDPSSSNKDNKSSNVIKGGLQRLQAGLIPPRRLSLVNNRLNLSFSKKQNLRPVAGSHNDLNRLDNSNPIGSSIFSASGKDKYCVNDQNDVNEENVAEDKGDNDDDNDNVVIMGSDNSAFFKNQL